MPPIETCQLMPLISVSHDQEEALAISFYRRRGGCARAVPSDVLTMSICPRDALRNAYAKIGELRLIVTLTTLKSL